MGIRVIRNSKFPNSFCLDGLTLGKLMAIQHALKVDPNRSSVGDDILTALDHAGVYEAVTPEAVKVDAHR